MSPAGPELLRYLVHDVYDEQSWFLYIL